MKIRMYDHNQNIIGYLWSENGEVKATPKVEHLLDLDYIIKQPGTGRILSKKDGDKLLAVLPIMFSGTGMRADIVSDNASVTL